MLLKELSEAVGVSGQEGDVRKIVIDAIREHVDELHIDAMGSVIAVKKGTGKTNLRVMLAAHMDEVGFMVTGYDGNGLIRFTSVGGIDDRILPGLRVKVGKAGLQGVVLWTPIHKNRDQNVTKISSLRIDVGLTSKDAVSGKVKLGERISFDSAFTELNDNVVRGKAFDDRVGCSLLVDVLQADPYPVDVLAAFTVQEEVGLRGAQVAAQRLSPDVALVLEGTTAHDLPDPNADPDEDEPTNPTCRMGDGPTLTVMDRSLIVNPRMLNFLRQTADSHAIPYQLKTRLGGGTDGGAIHTSNAGVMTGVISMPCRYIHSPNSLLHRADYDATLRLVKAALNDMKADLVNGR